MALPARPVTDVAAGVQLDLAGTDWRRFGLEGGVGLDAFADLGWLSWRGFEGELEFWGGEWGTLVGWSWEWPLY